jgi:hypothetical protein
MGGEGWQAKNQSLKAKNVLRFEVLLITQGLDTDPLSI